jgi:hypothetical protein
VRVWLTQMAETGAPGPPAKFKANRAQLMVGFDWIRKRLGSLVLLKILKFILNRSLS